MKLTYMPDLKPLVDQMIDTTLSQALTPEEDAALTTFQLVEMSADLHQHLLDALDGYDLKIPDRRGL